MSSTWETRAQSYVSQIEGAYHRHRREVIEALLDPLPGGSCVDFGCGDGAFMEYLSGLGANVIGIDPVAPMVEAARQRLGEASDVRLGDVSELATFNSASVDVLLAANVLAYLEPDEETLFYESANRIVRPGGALVITHSNELFDLYTLNRYTADFHRRHFSSDVTTLLARPRDPDRTPHRIRANPLSYRHTLAQYQFDEERQEFISLHPQPPLLMGFDPDDIDSRTYPETLRWPEADRWKLLFQCSMFGSRSVRREEPAAGAGQSR